MFKTVLQCPNCRNDVSLESARTEIKLPDQSTGWKKAQLIYTICPRCSRDFRVRGERRASIIILCAFFGVLLVGFFSDSWWPLIIAAAILVLQKRLVQVLVRAEHA
jgi:uncharacterized protein YbaR (Trm112 family)